MSMPQQGTRAAPGTLSFAIGLRFPLNSCRVHRSRVLVLDDEPLISMMLQDWLHELAYETVGPANSVQSALVLIESMPPDAAILDLCLGNERSYAVATTLRARGIPFAFATGYGDNSMVGAFTDEMIVSKPFDFEAIKDVLARLLGSRTHAGLAE